MQTPYDIGAGNAAEALDQADGLIVRDPETYRSVGDVIESYAENASQTDGVTQENVDEMQRGFIVTLRKAGIDYTPHGFWGGWTA